MPRHVSGYYSARRKSVLGEFDRLAALLEPSLVARYGEAFASTLRKDIRAEYERLIPEIPHLPGLRARVLNFFLLGAAQELAVYKAMTTHGKPPGEVWELCHQAVRLAFAALPRWKRWVLRRATFSRLVRTLVARRARRRQPVRLGNFEVEYLLGDGDTFDFGVNYRQCGTLAFVRGHGGAAFAPYMCMSDIAMSEALGWGLTRTQTLADGCAYCDFRFKKGAPTTISSKTPEVQETIERIRKRELEARRAASG